MLKCTLFKRITMTLKQNRHPHINILSVEAKLNCWLNRKIAISYDLYSKENWSSSFLLTANRYPKKQPHVVALRIAMQMSWQSVLPK